MIVYNSRIFNSSFRIAFSNKNKRTFKNGSWIMPKCGYDTGIKIYNCITKTKVPLILQSNKVTSWYTCGPTVYDSTHIGHASCYMKLDIIQRILKNYFNIEIVTAMNITDIDDKIIRKAKECNTNSQTISQMYEREFWNDMKSLKIQRPDIKIRVTENIPYIIDFISKLLKYNQAYIGQDNSVYFHVNKYKNYGKLQFLNKDELYEYKGCSIKKENIDFALWKAQKEINEPAWTTPWTTATNGRPGWHIECSALATKIFGDKIDFHCGGLDLKFPHHENEEAQSCCYHNTDQWVNYWLHTGQLNLKGQEQKMSKSLKNTINVSELLQKYTSDEFRMACALSNYRNSMEFSDELMILAKTTLNKFDSFLSDCQAYLDGKTQMGEIEPSYILKGIHKTKNAIDTSLKDDFDTSKCIGHLSEFVSDINKISKSYNESYTSSSIVEMAAAKSFVQKILTTMGFSINTRTENIINLQEDVNLNNMIEKLVEIRYNIRQLAALDKNQNLFEISDEIRQVLKNENIEIKDHKKGSTWSKLKKND
ncbi:probable cysteine--tRNA ligase, mitochondrial [Condylostylus longicornis]|uniref:probable cysteine--tRNA ligase, mitochondrial n=1 Tax=Condylostylus longicornis TaxID=2530218 RepID=UPI00244E2ED5|nr:probable cysteine--tRNA ligase, mitochondrial [Condylostylus longicornis]